MLPKDLSKLLKKAYSLDRKAEKIAAAEKASEQLTRQKESTTTESKSDKEQSDKTQLAKKPDERS